MCNGNTTSRFVYGGFLLTIFAFFQIYGSTLTAYVEYQTRKEITPGVKSCKDAVNKMGKVPKVTLYALSFKRNPPNSAK